ncbi:MAG: SDR family oxidoreductase [Pseudomonadales bacterium]|nr:SDR family oxidoreductase [Pseudomonadales bacterium]
MKNIVITGGTSGIGAAVVSRILERKHQVYILDISKPQEKRATFIPCNMGSRESIDTAIAGLPATIDALINIAGVSGTKPGEIVIAVNFLGLRHLAQALFTRLGGGCVVNVASTAGRDWSLRETEVRSLLDTQDFASGIEWIANNKAVWQENPYKFSKQCAAAYTYRAVKLAMAHSVRVNCVNPGIVGTQLSTDFKNMLGSEKYDWVVAQIGREGRPDDIAQVIEYLSIGECQWLNGVEIVVDGGYTAGIIDGWIKPPA